MKPPIKFSHISSSATSLPLYLQLSELLIREIQSGRLISGQKLPPERQMAYNYQTTVTTLRKALAILEEKKMLKRVHGSGNYVQRVKKVDSVYSMFHLELRSGGGLPTANVLDVRFLDKPSELLVFGKSHRATRIRRLRKLDDVPIAIEEIWLDEDAGRVDQSMLQDSMYRLYKMHLGFWITRAEDKVGINQVPDWAPKEFDLKTDDLAGYIERSSWAQAPYAVEFSRTWFDAKKANYVQRLI